MKTMTKHIIIEGMDKTGKSTLAKRLSEEFGIPIKKFSAPTDNKALQEYAAFLLNEKVPHIIDRCYMSELAYGPVKRGSSQISQLMKQMLETAVKDNVIGIYCYDSSDAIKHRFDEDGETETRKSEVDQIVANYNRELDSSLINWLSVSMDDLKKIPQYITGYVGALLAEAK